MINNIMNFRKKYNLIVSDLDGSLFYQNFYIFQNLIIVGSLIIKTHQFRMYVHCINNRIGMLQFTHPVYM